MLRAPKLRQGVEKRVAGGVVGLARRSENRGRRREQDEEIEGGVLRQLVKVPRALNLGRHHPFKPVTRQLSNHAIVEATGRVHDAAQRQRVRDAGEDIFQLSSAGHVGAGHCHRRAHLLERRKRELRFRRCTGAADENQMARTVVDHPARDRQAETAGAAGHEICRLGSEHTGRRCVAHAVVRYADDPSICADGTGPNKSWTCARATAVGDLWLVRCDARRFHRAAGRLRRCHRNDRRRDRDR